jgi:hypothetical protein
MAAEPKSVTFQTTVAASGNNTGIEVPGDLIEQLAAGKRPPVLVNVNGYEYRNTVAVMGGRHMISISAAVRNATGLKGGDPIRVTLTVADTAREVNVPPDFAAALAADERARGILRQALQQHAALPRRQHQRREERRHPPAAHRQGHRVVPRRQAEVTTLAAPIAVGPADPRPLRCQGRTKRERLRKRGARPYALIAESGTR